MTAEDRHLRYIIWALFFSMLPHVFTVPPWATGWAAALWVLALVRQRAGKQTFSKWLLMPLTGLGVLLVIAGSGGMFDPNAGLVLLIVMAGIKPLEIRTHRDRMITVFIAYFSVISTLLFNDSIYMVFYMLMAITLITGVMIQLNAPSRSLTSSLSKAGVMICESIPLMVALFFLFPRIPDAMWGGITSRQGTSGFSSTLTAGDISNLVKSNKIAFRVRFTEGNPVSSLYWRGMVLPDFTGETWRLVRDLPDEPPPDAGSDRISYQMTLEPHRETWLFPLDWPLGVADPMAVNPGCGIWKTRRPVTTRFLVHGVSTSTVGWSDTSIDISRRYLKLPVSGNPRARALGNTWAATGLPPQDRVEKALSFFSNQGFGYSLSPPALGRDTVDAFLFTTRIGFCEHFASSFTYLMRAAGVPARVVVGYLGGEYNPIGDYYLIRQSDAHAWSEVWISGSGWTRIDPTLAVAPDRVDGGPVASDAYEAMQGLLSRFGFSEIYTAWLGVRMALDAVQQQWSWWVIDYTQEKQMGLITRLVDHAKQIAMGLILIGFGIFLFTGSRYYHRRNQQMTGAAVLTAAYCLFCKKMSGIGAGKPACMGPSDYRQAISRMHPALEPAVSRLLSDYIRLRYAQKQVDMKAAKIFAKQVRTFQPTGLK